MPSCAACPSCAAATAAGLRRIWMTERRPWGVTAMRWGSEEGGGVTISLPTNLSMYVYTYARICTHTTPRARPTTRLIHSEKRPAYLQRRQRPLPARHAQFLPQRPHPRTELVRQGLCGRRRCCRLGWGCWWSRCGGGVVVGGACCVCV